MRRRVVWLVMASALVTAGTAQAKLALTFDKATATPGERVRLTFGSYFTSKDKAVYVYLVHAPILGDVLRPAYGGGTVREGPPAKRAGVYRVGRTLSKESGLTFRVPVTRPGRYAAVIWCPACPSSYLLAQHQGGIPDGAYVRPTRTLLRVRAKA